MEFLHDQYKKLLKWMQIFWQRFVFCWWWMLVKEWNYLISLDAYKKLYITTNTMQWYMYVYLKLYMSSLDLILINNGNRTEWSPIRSVIIRVINKIGRPRSGSPICLITSMITDRIGRHEVLLPINHNYNKICDILGFFKVKTQEILRVFFFC